MENTNLVGDNKENMEAHFRNKIELWREKRYEKLCSRLLKCKEEDGNKGLFVSPSVLGMKCPKNVGERVNDQECKSHNKRKALGDFQPNSKPRKSGMRCGLAKKFAEGPAVRQTMTSKLRAFQNNPFMDNPIGNKFEAVNLNGTFVRKTPDESDVESPDAMFSTPAIRNHHPQFPDSVSVIKHAKSPSHIPHSKTFLKYD